MYEINLIKDGNNYYYKSKNEFGQIILLKLTSVMTYKHISYWVCFQIGKRKDGYKYMQTTGKDGLKSLIWAKNCIKNFIESIKNRTNFYLTDETLKYSVIIQWDDNRRRNVYYYGLKSLRFYYGMIDGIKVLIKDIK